MQPLSRSADAPYWGHAATRPPGRRCFPREAQCRMRNARRGVRRSEPSPAADPLRAEGELPPTSHRRGRNALSPNKYRGPCRHSHGLTAGPSLASQPSQRWRVGASRVIRRRDGGPSAGHRGQRVTPCDARRGRTTANPGARVSTTSTAGRTTSRAGTAAALRARPSRCEAEPMRDRAGGSRDEALECRNGHPMVSQHRKERGERGGERGLARRARRRVTEL